MRKPRSHGLKVTNLEVESRQPVPKSSLTTITLYLKAKHHFFSHLFKNKRDGLLSYRFWRSTYLKFSWREYFVILWKFTPCLFLLSVMPFMFLCGGVFIYLFLLAVILIYRTYNWLSVLFSHLTTKILTINISVIACSLEKMWWNTFIVTHFWQLSVFIFRWQIHL